MVLPWPVFHLPAAGPVRSQEGDAFATVLPGNVLGVEPPALPRSAPGDRLILWSGWMEAGWMDDGPARPAEGVFPQDHRTWAGSGLAGLNSFCDRAHPELESRRLTLCFRPHARHVLSDPRSCVTFLSRRRAGPFGLILDPAGFLTGTMLASAEDHLTRAFEALASNPAVAAVALTNLETVPGAPDESAAELRACSIGSGLLSAGLLTALLVRFWPAGRPVLLNDPAADAACIARHAATLR